MIYDRKDYYGTNNFVNMPIKQIYNMWAEKKVN